MGASLTSNVRPIFPKLQPADRRLPGMVAVEHELRPPDAWLDFVPLVRGADPLLFGNPRGYRDQELAGGVAQMYAPEAV